MVEECSPEFGQIPILGLPFADPPREDNMATTPSTVNTVKPFGVSVRQAPSNWSQGILWTILATKEQTGGSYSLMEELRPRWSGPPPRTNKTRLFYLLDGEITMIAGDMRLAVKGGSLVYIPAECVHTFRVDSETARVLNLYLPGGFERVVTEFGTRAQSRTVPPSELHESGTPEQMKALVARVRMHIVALPDVLRATA